MSKITNEWNTFPIKTVVDAEHYLIRVLNNFRHGMLCHTRRVLRELARLESKAKRLDHAVLVGIMYDLRKPDVMNSYCESITDVHTTGEFKDLEPMIYVTGLYHGERFKFFFDEAMFTDTENWFKKHKKELGIK